MAHYVNTSADHTREHSFFFVGDGTEVVACEARESVAAAEAARLNRENDTSEYNFYACNPSEVTKDDAGNWVWAYPSERAAAEAEYDLPTLDEVIARQQ